MVCKYTILLVEDDEDDFILLETLLKNAENIEFVIDWVDKYEVALSHIQKVKPDILLVDYNLCCEHTGAELVREIKEQGLEVPVVLITGQDKEAIGDELVNQLFDGYIHKSNLTPDVLTETIQNVVSKVR